MNELAPHHQDARKTGLSLNALKSQSKWIVLRLNRLAVVGFLILDLTFVITQCIRIIPFSKEPLHKNC